MQKETNVSKTSSLDVGFSIIPVGYLPFARSKESKIKKRCKRSMQYNRLTVGMVMDYLLVYTLRSQLATAERDAVVMERLL